MSDKPLVVQFAYVNEKGELVKDTNARTIKVQHDLEDIESPIYVVHSLAEGFFCQNPKCGRFTGDIKEFHTRCPSCETERPTL